MHPKGMPLLLTSLLLYHQSQWWLSCSWGLLECVKFRSWSSREAWVSLEGSTLFWIRELNILENGIEGGFQPTTNARNRKEKLWLEIELVYFLRDEAYCGKEVRFSDGGWMTQSFLIIFLDVFDKFFQNFLVFLLQEVPIDCKVLRVRKLHLPFTLIILQALQNISLLVLSNRDSGSSHFSPKDIVTNLLITMLTKCPLLLLTPLMMP